ncbi:MAG: ATP-binding protein [Pseudomonadota bacterium]|nr:ATP-binding protein [Pseudomonadota bacterium]
MNAPTGRSDSGVDQAARELARLQQQIVAERAQLAGLQREVAQAQARRGSYQRTRLGEPAAKEPGVQAPGRKAGRSRQSAGDHALAMAEHDRQHAQQQEANAHLILAALGAQDLQAAAEEAQRRQTEFLAVLAHELRNPLAPIRAAAALLGMIGDDETMLPQLQAVIERQVTHMSRLVGDLLDMSRVSTGKLRLECRSVDLAGLINQVIDGCRPAIESRAQILGVHLPARALYMHADPVRLAQIFTNLLDNASKYTPEGGEIGLRVEATDEVVTIAISDTGIGITAEALPDVFKPFVQDPHATGFNGAGLGIGLTVVRALVEAHGGSVHAASAGSGLGSRFAVTLPLLGGCRTCARRGAVSGKSAATVALRQRPARHRISVCESVARAGVTAAHALTCIRRPDRRPRTLRG